MCDVCGDNRFEIIDAYKKKLIEDTNIKSSPEEMAVIDNILFRFWQMGWLPAAQPERVFEKIIVEYPHPDLCTYKEYKGKPYFSIKYTENGQGFIGYGTYKPDVLSEYLKTYFIPVQPERKNGRWVHDGYDHPHGVDWMHCSECGWREPHVPAAMTNFCPNCGAYMRGEQDE